MKRRKFITNAAGLLVPTIFIPRLLRAQAYTYGDPAWMGLIATPTSSAPFAPTDISGLQAWWKADSLSLNDGDSVSTWSTSGGPSRDATNSGSVRPVYKTNIKNSKPVVRFDRTASQVLTFTTTSISAFSIFVVAKMTEMSSYGGPLDWRVAGQNGFMFSGDVPTISTWNPHLCIWNGTTETANVKSSSTSAPTAFALEYWDSGQAFYRNASSGSVSGGVAGFGTRQGNIGHSYGYVSMDACEIIVYDSVLSTGNRQSVETYLNGRWAIY